MVLTEWVKVSDNPSCRNRFMSLGYVAEDGVFTVRPDDLSKYNKSKIEVQCDTCGRIYEISWADHYKKKDKSICRSCCSFATKTWDFINNEFSKRGYTLITDYYVNAHQHLQYRCEKHPEHVQEIIYNSLQRGCGCWYCGREAATSKRTLTIDDVRMVVESKGLIFISCDYKNEYSLVQFKCPKHLDDVQESIYNNIQQGSRKCSFCVKEKFTGRNNHNYADGSKYVSQYVRSFIKDWRKRIIAESGYKCAVSNVPTDGHFVVHHLKSSNTVLKTILSEYGYTPQEKIPYDILSDVVDKYVEEHENLGGVFISQQVHKLFHKVYGNRHNTPEQFWEFKQNYINGVYDHLLTHTGVAGDQSPNCRAPQDLPCV